MEAKARTKISVKRILGLLVLAFLALVFVGNLARPGLQGYRPADNDSHNGLYSSNQRTGVSEPEISEPSEEPQSEELAQSAGSSPAMKQSGTGGVTVADASTIPQLPQLDEKIIKTGQLEVKVKKGGFDKAFNRALFLATSYGGYVGGSSVLNSGSSQPVTGTITIKVPSSKFERLLTDLRKLGKVQSLEVNSEDVSQEYVDLKSRLRNLRVQETFFLKLMSRAKTISDSMEIQGSLSELQEEIEKITGRINYLDAQTSYSSIQLTVTESGKAPHKKDDVKKDKWGTLTAFKTAAHAAVDTLNFTIVTLGYLLPWLVIGALAYLVYRRTVKRPLFGKSATAEVKPADTAGKETGGKTVDEPVDEAANKK